MRLNQITAPAHDLAASIAFYELLGLRLIVRRDHYARFELPQGEATFSLHLVEGPIPRANAPQLYFECEDVDFQVRRLMHAGVAFEQSPKDQPWLWREAWLRDPAGNALCLFHAGEARRYPPWRIDRPAAGETLHLIIRDGGQWAIAKLEGDDPDHWKRLQQEYADYKTSLGPYDLFALLAFMEREWPDIFLAHKDAISAFAKSAETRLVF